MKPTLEDAIILAALSFKGKVDKAGQPYILHLLHVMSKMDTDEERIIAVLHDIVEDTDMTLEYLSELGYDYKVTRALWFVTKLPSEAYEDFITRVMAGPKAAIKVKIADIRHNSDIGRIPSPTDEDHSRIKKYQAALARLEAVYEL